MKTLREFQQQLDKIRKLLKNVDSTKSIVDRSTALLDLKKILDQFQWDFFKEEVAQNAAAGSAELEQSIRQRREQLVLKLESQGIPIKRQGDYDRIGPLRIYYEKTKVVLKVGANLERSRLEEVDVDKLTTWIKAQFDQAVAPMRDFAEFSKLLRNALEQARVTGQTRRDGWVNLKLLFREVWLAKCRDGFSGKGMKAPSPKEYALVDFILDLAKWLQGDRSIPGGKLKLRAPSMGQNEEAVMIPSIASPWSEDLTLEAKLESITP